MNNSDTKTGDDATVDYDNYPKLEILPELPDLVDETTKKGGGRRRRSKSKKIKTVKRKKTRRHRRK